MANRFWVGGSATWDATAGSKWSTTTGGAGGSAIPGSADTAVFDGGSGAAVVTVAANIGGTNTISGITMTGTGNFTGTLDFATNNPSITITGTFSISGAGTRTVNLGSGTFTLTQTNGTAWDATTITGLTFNAGTSTLATSGNVTSNGNRTLTLNTLTYNIVSIGASSSGFKQSVVGAATIGTFNMTAPCYVSFANSTTLTVTNAFNWAGSSGSEIFLLGGNSATLISTASGSPTMSWAALNNIGFTGGATFTATNSFDLNGNSGITITAPSAGGSGGGSVIGS